MIFFFVLTRREEEKHKHTKSSTRLFSRCRETTATTMTTRRLWNFYALAKKKTTTPILFSSLSWVFIVSLDLDVSCLLCDTMAHTETKILFTFVQNPNFISFSIVDVVRCWCVCVVLFFCFLFLRFFRSCVFYILYSVGGVVVCFGGVVLYFISKLVRVFYSILRARKHVCVYVAFFSQCTQAIYVYECKIEHRFARIYTECAVYI